jgi:HD-like signal output (HDOD) protein/CheY-like chemotaxis protein
MTRILFVDDEAAFLDSLRTLLRRLRTGWDLSFALGGEQALDEIARGPLDVVISDLRMPGMDGAELLHLVSERAPAAARIVLSGYADVDLMVRAVPAAQQFLAKPCPAATLRRVVGRVTDLQHALGAPAMQALIGRGGCLPVLQSTEERIRLALDDRAVRPPALAAIAEADPAMSARVLQLANSALRPGDPVTSINAAVGRLGVDLVGRLPAALRDDAIADPPPEVTPEFGRVVEVSVATARLAAAFDSSGQQVDLAYSAGLLHQIGWILLAREAPAQLAELRRRQPADRPAADIERDALGVSSAQASAYLLGLWGLPEPIVDAVAHHQSIPPDRRAEMRVSALVHAARELLSQELAARTGAARVDELDLAALDELGLSAELPRWRELAAAEATSLEAV